MNKKTGSTQGEIFDAISREREYQDFKYGADRDLPMREWARIMTVELLECITAPSVDEAACEMLQVAAVVVACLERYGVAERTLGSTDSSALGVDAIKKQPPKKQPPKKPSPKNQRVGA